METLTPVVFKRRYSQKFSKDLAMMKRIDSIVAEKQTKRKLSTVIEDPNASDIISPVKETDMEDPPDPAPSDMVPIVEETDKEDRPDPQTGQSLDTYDSYAIGKSDFTDVASRENKPAD